MSLMPAIPRIPPLWRETRIGLEAAALRRSPVFRGLGLPAGERRPVLLIPGFMAGDASLGTMANWLRRAGYCTHRTGIRANLDCSEEACRRLEARLEHMAERHGERVVRGGEDLRHGARGLPVELLGDRHGGALVDDRELGLAAAGDDRHHAVAGLEPLDARAALDDLARQLEAGDVLRRARRRGVAALELVHVGAVEPGAADAHEQVGVAGDRVGVLLDGDRAVPDRGRAHRRDATSLAIRPVSAPG